MRRAATLLFAFGLLTGTPINPLTVSLLPITITRQAPWIAGSGPSSPFGVEATGWSGGSAGTTLAQQVGSTRASWTRYDPIQWSVVEPQESNPPQYDWSQYDAFLADPSAQGLTPIVVIGDTPVWAAADPSLPSGPIAPAHVSEFAQFVQAAVSRYSQSPYNVEYWELFNEPDQTTASYVPWEAPWGNDGSGYADMLQAVYPAIKAVAPQATVISGSLAYEWFTTEGGPFNQQFVVDVLTELNQHPELGKGFDVFGFHYYALFAPVWAQYGVDILGKTNYLRGVLTPSGYGSVPMMSTEIGQTGTPGNSASLQAQADYVPQVYARGMSGGLQAMIWYSLVVGTSDTGLLNADGSPKLAYTTYQVAASELGGTTFAETIPVSNIQLQGAPSSSFEGYLFNVTGASGYRAVVWLNAGSATLVVPISSLTVTTESGVPTVQTAGQDGTVNVAVGTSPVYLDLVTNPWISGPPTPTVTSTPTPTPAPTQTPNRTPTPTPTPTPAPATKVFLPSVPVH